MRMYEEKDLKDFEFWGGAIATAEMLTEEDFEEIEACMNDCGEEWSVTAINDLFWFDDESIAMWLGYESWDDLVDDRTEDEGEEPEDED
jgi:hypothetical protein